MSTHNTSLRNLLEGSFFEVVSCRGRHYLVECLYGELIARLDYNLLICHDQAVVVLIKTIVVDCKFRLLLLRNVALGTHRLVLISIVRYIGRLDLITANHIIKHVNVSKNREETVAVKFHKRDVISKRVNWLIA